MTKKYSSDKKMQNLFESFNRFLNEEFDSINQKEYSGLTDDAEVVIYPPRGLDEQGMQIFAKYSPKPDGFKGTLRQIGGMGGGMDRLIGLAKDLQPALNLAVQREVMGEKNQISVKYQQEGQPPTTLWSIKSLTMDEAMELAQKLEAVGLENRS